MYRVHIFLFVIFGLSLSSCFRWGPRNFSNFPKETALEKTYSYSGEILIVGAGASGLAAAKVLEQNHIDYKIIEATDRYGGRLKKNDAFADFPIDMGAEWIHNLPPILNRLKGQHGEHIEEVVIPYRLNESYTWNGSVLKKVPQLFTNAYFSFFSEHKFKSTTWYDYIEKNFAKDVQHTIRYNAPVSSIDYSEEKVVVTTRNDDVFVADKVLVTVSIGVLQSDSITFVPSLSQEKQENIDAVRFPRGFKLMMKFSEKFYPDVVACGLTDGEKAYYDVAFQKGAQDNILGLLVTGKSAEEYYELGSQDKILSSVLQELDTIFDGQASTTYMDSYLFEDWGRHQFTMGTWTNAALDRNFDVDILNQPLQNKVYFAGEIHDVDKQLGVPGAILSGFNAVEHMMATQ